MGEIQQKPDLYRANLATYKKLTTKDPIKPVFNYCCELFLAFTLTIR
jgi:hypothetical protein